MSLQYNLLANLCLHDYSSKYVCVCVCMYTCMRVCVWVCVCACVCSYMYVCMHAWMYARMYGNRYVWYMCECPREADTHACIHTRMHTYTWKHTYRYMHIHTFIHPSIHTYIHTYMVTHINTCTHTCKHTDIHAYIRTCTHIHVLGLCPMGASWKLISSCWTTRGSWCLAQHTKEASHLPTMCTRRPHPFIFSRWNMDHALVNLRFFTVVMFFTIRLAIAAGFELRLLLASMGVLDLSFCEPRTVLKTLLPCLSKTSASAPPGSKSVSQQHPTNVIDIIEKCGGVVSYCVRIVFSQHIKLRNCNLWKSYLFEKELS